MATRKIFAIFLRNFAKIVKKWMRTRNDQFNSPFYGKAHSLLWFYAFPVLIFCSGCVLFSNIFDHHPKQLPSVKVPISEGQPRLDTPKIAIFSTRSGFGNEIWRCKGGPRTPYNVDRKIHLPKFFFFSSSKIQSTIEDDF